jgi:hypothetical protein
VPAEAHGTGRDATRTRDLTRGAARTGREIPDQSRDPQGHGNTSRNGDASRPLITKRTYRPDPERCMAALALLLGVTLTPPPPPTPLPPVRRKPRPAPQKAA